MPENRESEPGSNLNEVAGQVKALSAQMSELAEVMARQVQEQDKVNQAYERLRLAAQACAASAKRAAELTERTRRLLCGEPVPAPEPLPDDGYDVSRINEAMAACARSEEIVAEADRNMADPTRLKALSAELAGVHAVIRKWLDEVSLDEPGHLYKARLMKERLELTERRLRETIANILRLPPATRKCLKEADARLTTIIEQASEEPD